MLFGENGTGKSSIIDAIDMICNQQAGSLDERGSSNRSHLPALGKDYGDVNIEIRFDKDTWTGTLNRTRPVATGPGTPPAALILRRSQLLRLVEARPADRYKEISRFINVAAIERCEATLARAARSANDRLAEAIRVKQGAEESLDRLWQAEGSPGANARAWAQERASADTSVLKLELERLNVLKAAFTELGVAEDAVTIARENLHQGEMRVKELESALAQLAATGEDASLELTRLLNQVKAFIALPREFDTCSICDQSVSADGLRREIDERLRQMEESQRLSDDFTAAERTRDHARTSLERVMN